MRIMWQRAIRGDEEPVTMQERRKREVTAEATVEAQETAVEADDGRAVSLPTPKVLIVDDSPANLMAFEVALEPLGYKIVKAACGRDALRCLLTHDFSLILMDVQMPALSGIDTVKLIKRSKKHRDIPILLITASCKKLSFIRDGYEAGAVDYIRKPCEPKILRSKVMVLVELIRQKEIVKIQAVLLRKHEREAMERRCERRYQDLIEAMPMCVWAAHEDGIFYYSNSAWLQYAGASSRAHVGRTLWRALHPDDGRHVWAVWRQALASQQAAEMQCRLNRRDGIYCWHIARAVPQREEDRVTGWIITATDIDEQKRAEQAEHLARKQAEATNCERMKDEFLATVSHELRTPLTAIVGWTELLRSGTLDGPGAERGIEIIARNVEKERRIVEDILDVSRIATGKLLVHLQTTDPAAIVHEVAEALRPMARAKGIAFESTVKSAGTLMLGDPDRLWQVAWKLVSNALKFTPSGGRVAIGFEHSAHRFILTVSDTGEGVLPEALPRVFECFNQEDRSPTRLHCGLGVGLAIVRELVELHGGSIRATSAGKGLGAMFTVELPSCAAPPAHVDSSRREPCSMRSAAAPCR
jgi:PAS domain S-box-containing protein